MKYLILTGDDFGKNATINAAIEQTHRAGLLTQASLLVTGSAVGGAVEIARRNPRMSVGLHLALVDAQATSVSRLTDGAGAFSISPAHAGLRYALDRRLRGDLEAEIKRQFARFLALGFPPVYWDGHTHLHLHPTIFPLAAKIACAHGFLATRLVREPGSPSVLPGIFSVLSRWAQPQLKKNRLQCCDQVFGLRATGRLTTERALAIFQRVPAALSELYFHPGAESEPWDFARLHAGLREAEIKLTSFQEMLAPSSRGHFSDALPT